jgi:hypothetical protein
MVEIGGDGQHTVHDNLFGEAATRQAVRTANAGQLAFLAAFLSPHRSGQPSQEPEQQLGQRIAQVWGHAEWENFVDIDMPYVSKHLWGSVDEDGRHPGVDLEGAYESWLRAAGKVDLDPRGARAVMEMCRLRMAECPGGPELLGLYDEYRHTGKRPKTDAQMWRQPVEAMRRAWKDSEPARQMWERARSHEAAPDRARLGTGEVEARLPVRVGPAGHGPPDARTAAGEAAHLLGFPEVTLPQLHHFQRHYGDAASRDGEALARQWLEHMRRSGLIDQAQHDAWREAVAAARRGEQHARWRVARGLDPAPTPDVAVARQVSQEQPGARHADDALRGEAATADHLAGHASQHHRITDRKLGRAVNDPRTEYVDEQDFYRLRANTERGVAELYDGQAARAADRGMASRMAAARPAPATIARAEAPASLVGKRNAQVVAARPSPPRRPGPGRGIR